jgi:hypothetical protein
MKAFTRYCIYIQYLVIFLIMIKHIERPQSTLKETLPLFAELAEYNSVERLNRPGTRASFRQKVRQKVRPKVGRTMDQHLIAADRLAKTIRRLPDYSAAQTHAGQAICRHLIALLEESNPETPDG